MGLDVLDLKRKGGAAPVCGAGPLGRGLAVVRGGQTEGVLQEAPEQAARVVSIAGALAQRAWISDAA
jgi:hypothetical protein